jgi:hypothetical protein
VQRHAVEARPSPKVASHTLMPKGLHSSFAQLLSVALSLLDQLNDFSGNTFSAVIALNRKPKVTASIVKCFTDTFESFRVERFAFQQLIYGHPIISFN